MKPLWIVCIAIFTIVGVSVAAPQVSPKMRPYAGIGVLLVPVTTSDQADPLYLYDEPALSRRDALKYSSIPSYEWIFGSGSTSLPLIVAARKGTWLRVAYDDAGREAWLNKPGRNAYQPWDTFFRMHVSRLLPGLQKKYYQLYQLPNSNGIATLSASQIFKVLRLENDWAQIVLDQNTIGWLRWRDEDGRLLIGITTPLPVLQP